MIPEAFYDISVIVSCTSEIGYVHNNVQHLIMCLGDEEIYNKGTQQH